MSAHIQVWIRLNFDTIYLNSPFIKKVVNITISSFSITLYIKFVILMIDK